MYEKEEKTMMSALLKRSKKLYLNLSGGIIKKQFPFRVFDYTNRIKSQSVNTGGRLSWSRHILVIQNPISTIFYSTNHKSQIDYKKIAKFSTRKKKRRTKLIETSLNGMKDKIYIKTNDTKPTKK